MISLIFLLLGLAVGSFLNVVVYRLRVAEDLTWGRSHCPHCQTTIAWYDNIPVLSFILLKFKCRACQEKISWQYPLVELFTAGLFVLVGSYFFKMEDMRTWIVSGFYLAALAALVVILVYDFLYLEIPSIVLSLGIFGTIIFNLWSDWGQKVVTGMSVLEFSTYSGLLAAMAAFSFFFAMVAVSKEKWMGMGDAYLVIFLGLLVGWPGIGLTLMVAFSAGALMGIALILAKKKKMGSQLPFAPFLVLGTIISLFWQTPIIKWYSGICNIFL
jgi:leader peptidase (prepilin peptidase)/N-methyltransferase